MKTLEKNPIKQHVRLLRQTLGLTQEEAAYILGVTTTTLSRWANNRTSEPDPAHEAKIEMLIEVLKEAQEAIKSEGLIWWFRTPNPFLGDLRPLDLLRSPSGATKVRNLIGTMRWGLAA